MIRILLVNILAFSIACHAVPPTDPRMGSVTKQDFYLYSCVREYMRANSIQIFDGSVSYGVEYSNLNFEELSEINKAAKQFASSIRAPDYKDVEHGLPAVLVLCQNQSKKIPVTK
jgi:hypothetical protein